MVPQVRDLPVNPAGEDLYTVLHNYTASQLSTFLHNEMVYMVGNSVGIFLSGIAFTLGVSSILLLSSKRSLSTQDTILRALTIVLLFLVIVFQILALFTTFLPFISLSHSYDKRVEGEMRSGVAFDVILAAVVGTTDGLLVWRCFMVQRALSNSSSKWGNIFWIFPAFLWLVTIAMVITATAMISSTWYCIVGASGFGTNLFLNLYATIFISTRLLLHRRTLRARLGNSAPTTQHIYIIGILLESAAVNLPMAAACAIGIGIGRSLLESTLLPIAVANQVLASVLIIYQAALGRVLSQQREFEVKRLVEVAGHNTSRFGTEYQNDVIDIKSSPIT